MSNPCRGITNRQLIIGQICGFLVMDVRIIFMNDKENHKRKASMSFHLSFKDTLAGLLKIKPKKEEDQE